LFQIIPLVVVSQLSVGSTDMSFVHDVDPVDEEEEVQESIDKNNDDPEGTSKPEVQADRMSAKEKKEVNKWKEFVPLRLYAGTFAITVLSLTVTWLSQKYMSRSEASFIDLQISGDLLQLSSQLKTASLDLVTGRQDVDSRERIKTIVSEIRKQQRIMLYGSGNPDKPGCLSRSTSQVPLLFQPSCLRDPLPCLDPSHKYFYITNNGLNELLGYYLSQALAMSLKQGSVSTLDEQFQFIWYV
jgi:hypothetical protein